LLCLSVCLSVCPHVTIWEPLNGFSLNFILRCSTKIRRDVPIVVEERHITSTSHEDPYGFLRAEVARWGIPSEPRSHLGAGHHDPTRHLAPPTGRSLTLDESDNTGVIHRGQSSTHVERAIIRCAYFSLLASFLSLFLPFQSCVYLTFHSGNIYIGFSYSYSDSRFQSGIIKGSIHVYAAKEWRKFRPQLPHIIRSFPFRFRSNSLWINHFRHLVGLPWTGDQPVTRLSVVQDSTA
jgi:hypothetical protein